MAPLAELRERCPSAHLYYKDMLQSQIACVVEKLMFNFASCTQETGVSHNRMRTAGQDHIGRQHGLKASSPTCSNTKCNADCGKMLRALCRRVCRSKIMTALIRMLAGCCTYFGDSVCECRSLETEQERLSWLHSPHDQSTNHPPTGA